MNKVILTGNLVREPELKQTPSGKSVITNAVAVRRDMKDENGEYPTDFVEIVIWGQQAEYIRNYGHKGDRVELSGRWQQRTYTDRNGNNRRADECVVESISVFSRQQASAPEQAQTPAPAPKREEPQGEQMKMATPTARPAPSRPKAIDDDDLPF